MLHNPSFFHWIDDYWVPILYYLSLCFKVLPLKSSVECKLIHCQNIFILWLSLSHFLLSLCFSSCNMSLPCGLKSCLKSFQRNWLSVDLFAYSLCAQVSWDRIQTHIICHWRLRPACFCWINNWKTQTALFSIFFLVFYNVPFSFRTISNLQLISSMMQSALE